MPNMGRIIECGAYSDMRLTKLICVTVISLVVTLVVADGAQNNNSDIRNRNQELTKSAIRLWQKNIYKERNNTDKHSCHLHPKDRSVHNTVKRLIKHGVKIIKYELNFTDYGENPLLVGNKNAYQGNIWSRVTSKHGSNLLLLSFNYDVMSLTMLTIGVETLPVDLEDYPQGCFGNLTESLKMDATRRLLMNDFKFHLEKDELWEEEDDYICHNVIKETHLHWGDIHYACCSKDLVTQEVKCEKELKKDDWILILYFLLDAARVLFFLFGPMIFQGYIFKDVDVHRSVPYTVNLPRKLRCKIRKSDFDLADCADEQKSSVNPIFKNPVKNLAVPMAHLQDGCSKIGEDATVTAEIEQASLIVDHTDLMGQNDLEMGPVGFFYNEIIRCGCMASNPFTSCKISNVIVGDIRGHYLCCKLKNLAKILNVHCIRFFTWGQLTTFIGQCLLALLIPAPFTIRVFVYGLKEYPEIVLRDEAVRLQQDLNGVYVNFFWLGHGWPMTVYTCYVCYFASLFMLCFMRMLVYGPDLFDSKIKDIVLDLRKISYSSILRMLCAHLIFPFEKFGLCCGIIAFILHIPFILFACCVAMFYAIPLFYTTGRIMFQFRLFRRTCPCIGGEENIKLSERHSMALKTHRKVMEDQFTLNRNFQSCDKIFFFNFISPNDWEFPRLPSGVPRKMTSLVKKCLKHLVSVTTTIASLIFLWVVLLMYAEAVRFFLEMFIMVVIGVIINSKETLDYFTLGVWIIVYFRTCFNQVEAKYLEMSDQIFDVLKDELSASILSVTRLPEECQKNAAFKYLSKGKICDILRNAKKQIAQDKYEMYKDYVCQPDQLSIRHDCEDCPIHWEMRNLVLFLNKKDEVRIPRALFNKVVDELRATGCPGPVRANMLRALRQVFYMVVVLIFVFMIIMSFGHSSDVSASNQLMLTAAGGLVPFVLRWILMPKGKSIDLSFYFVKGKLEEIFMDFIQTWPGFDLHFQIVDEHSEAPGEEVDDVGDVCNMGPAALHIGKKHFHYNNKFRYSTFSLWDGPRREIVEIGGKPLLRGEVV